jgi:universal stress protein A
MYVSAPDYRHILVAIDIYSSYEPVLNRALSFAGSKDKISLMYVTAPQVYFEPYAVNVGHDFMQQIEQRATKRLLEIANQHGISEDSTHLLVGDAADAIHKFADENSIDLIVLGTHGRSGIKLLLGSTANSVLHGAKCDVLAVRV